MGLSPLYATLTPTPYEIPIADGSGLLDAWVTPGLTNPMTTDQDIIVATVGGTPDRLGVGAPGEVLTVGSSGIIDWATPTGGFTNPMTTRWDLIVGGVAGAAARLGVGTVGQVLTVGSGGIVDWETPASSGGTVTTVSVVSANGFAGTVATATTTPAITLRTTITGILSGNGTAISAATTTGSGDVVLATTPTLITPVIGAATGTSLVLSGGFTSGAVAGVTGFIDFKGLTSGTVRLSVADAAGTWTMKLPTSAGTNLFVLQTDGSGNTSWVAQTGGGSGTVTSGTATQMAYYPASSASVSSTPALTVSSAGRISIQSTALASGVTSYLTVTAPADVGMTTGTEAIGIFFNSAATRTWAGSTGFTNQSEFKFVAPTYAFASATGTITNASTVTINAAPTQGTNCVLTNAYALRVQAGTSIFEDFLRVKISAMTNPIIVGNTSSATTYGIISFNGAVTTTGLMGFIGGGGSDLSLAYNVATSGTHRFNVNNVNAVVIRSNGIEGAIGATTANTAVVTTLACTTLAASGAVTMTANTASTSPSTGTLVVTGGIGASGAININGGYASGTPSGGTSGVWKFGIRVAVATVHDTTQYIQLDVGGVAYKLALAV